MVLRGFGGIFFRPYNMTSPKQDCNYGVKEKTQIYGLMTVKAIILTNRGWSLIKNSYDFLPCPWLCNFLVLSVGGRTLPELLLRLSKVIFHSYISAASSYSKLSFHITAMYYLRNISCWIVQCNSWNIKMIVFHWNVLVQFNLLRPANSECLK